MTSELLTLFKDILEVESTSGKEDALGHLLYEKLQAPHKELLEVGDGMHNLLLKWGRIRKSYSAHIWTQYRLSSLRHSLRTAECWDEGPVMPKDR